ncbi:L-lactate permease [Flammeovirgaceae bacterium 311]|nr:L-lactate permease [Flammeovirgaceae bacterium 311]
MSGLNLPLNPECLAAMAYFLALLPIVLLIVLSLLRSVKEAVLVAALLSAVLFFYWGAGVNHFLGTLAVSLVTTLNILMIVFGAAFLYNIMDKTGMIGKISHSLDDLHPSKELRFFLLAICLTAFFEGWLALVRRVPLCHCCS